MVFTNLVDTGRCWSRLGMVCPSSVEPCPAAAAHGAWTQDLAFDISNLPEYSSKMSVPVMSPVADSTLRRAAKRESTTVPHLSGCEDPVEIVRHPQTRPQKDVLDCQHTSALESSRLWGVAGQQMEDCRIMFGTLPVFAASNSRSLFANSSQPFSKD